MNFENEILASFGRLGKSPRGNQVEYIDKVISAYLIDGKQNVILCAPTGTGKSIIGAVVADTIHAILDIPRLASFILMGTNILTEQYSETFKDNNDFVLVKGASNYECAVLDSTADNCCESAIRKSKEKDLVEIANKFCTRCEYAQLKKDRHIKSHLITNYSYFFIDRLFTNQHLFKTITIWDEAHTVNNAFAEHCAIYVSEKRLITVAEEISDVLKLGENDTFLKLKKIRDVIKKGSIDESNYMEHLQVLHTCYKSIEEQALYQAKSALRTDLKLYTKLNKLSKKYCDLAGKIGDLIDYGYEHVFEFNDKTKEVTVKPIFVKEMFNSLINSDFQLFMSATVSPPLLIETLGLNPADTAFIKLPPSFPIENKKVVFFNIDKLNYTSLKAPEVIAKINKACSKLVLKHTEENESGIILTPSFDITEVIAKGLEGKPVRVFQHERGTKLAALIEIFKRCKEPSVLISPSLFEGISLDDDLSRYQVIVKTPYASLGERRTSYIATHHKTMYELETILKIIQGAGRSVRSAEDYATTYMLDSNLSWIWKSPLNVWKDEFSVVYQTLA